MERHELLRRKVDSLEAKTWLMHKWLHPEEYGLGEDLTDKEVLELINELVDESLDVIQAESVDEIVPQETE